ncbi:GPI-anchored surface protein, putative [Bodo saltans]|uniref:GPI-anchored surface protein, putative n=1 Tax=Bodo saltans TaxID=75058 RepID=A0A0S4IN36_BODSA|nr:GPI-anchored surface protein, putative [Bodo saltans]|eukprot:CUF59999.1 GPI-anchored surface protein, putative [Bodo saltans]
MVLPPSAGLAFLDPTSGMYQPLIDTSVLTNNSRLRVIRGHQSGATASRVSSSVKLTSHSSAGLLSRTASTAAPIGNGGGGGSFFDSEMSEATILELLVYHAQVVRLLSSQLRPDKDITPQDIAASFELQSDGARALVGDMWRQKNATTIKAGGPGLFASAMSQAKIVTQFSLQQGATERETSEGDAATQLKATVSAFQARVDRLEKELADVSTLYESTQQLLLVTSQEKERAIADVEAKLDRYQRENELLRAATKEATFRSTYLEKELTHAQETHQRAQLDSIYNIEGDDGGDTGGGAMFSGASGAPPAKAVRRHTTVDAMDLNFLPTTAQEEKYLEITRRSAAAVTGGGGVRAGGGGGAGGHHHHRPTTAPAAVKSPGVYHLSPIPGSSLVQQRITSANSANRNGKPSSSFGPPGRSPLRLSTSYSQEDTTSSQISPTSRHASYGISVVVRSLPRGSISARQETLQINDPTITQSFPRFIWYLRERCGLTLTGATPTSVEVSYVANGLRKMIASEDDLFEFVRLAEAAPPLPGSSRGPCPMSISVIEFNAEERAGIGSGDESSVDPQLASSQHLKSPESPLSRRDASPTDFSRSGNDTEHGHDDDGDEDENGAFVPRTDAQRARVEAARFLGKKIEPADLRRPMSQGATEDGDDASLRSSSPRKSSRIVGVFSRLRKANGLGGASASSIGGHSANDALSTRSLFLHAASITVPREDEMRAMFQTLSKGSTTVDRVALAEFLIKRYDDIGEPSKFYRMAGLPSSGPPLANNVSQGGGGGSGRSLPPPVTVEEFCMIIYRLVRE